jgi:hypothetical protein
VRARIKDSVSTKEGSRDIYATVSTGGSFGSSSLQQEMGLGQATGIREIAVTWPRTGKTQTFRNVSMAQSFKLREGDPVPTLLQRNRIELSLTPPEKRRIESLHKAHQHESGQIK